MKLGFIKRSGALGRTHTWSSISTQSFPGSTKARPTYGQNAHNLERLSSGRRISPQPHEARVSAHADGWTMNRQHEGYHSKMKKRKIEQVEPFEGTSEQVLRYEVLELLKTLQQDKFDADEAKDAQPNGADGNISSLVQLPERSSEVELTAVRLSSTGDGLAVSNDYPDHVFIVPFCLPDEIVKAKVVASFARDKYTKADFIKIIKPSGARHDELVRCKYFGECSGCQLQMLPYEEQLKHKRGIVEQAYKAFSNLNPELIPHVRETLPSPMQYGYRTKLTPHFDGSEMERVGGIKKFVRPPSLGYSIKNRKRVMEIEDCPIGTDVVRQGLKRERALLSQRIHTLKNGATILLRESTKRIPNVITPKEDDTNDEDSSTTKDLIIRTSTPTHTIEKSCISDMNGTATEYVDDFQFQSRAGSFFQNNNSILSSFTAYVRENAVPPPSTSSGPPLKYLIDAYCGSGLFTITLSSVFTSSLGVDIDPAGIRCARLNAQANNVPNTGFIDADAAKLFIDVPFPADQTVVVIDPPRKGCSEGFLKQLLEYGPKRVVYVSCNVNTQARDVGMLVRGRVDGFDTVLSGRSSEKNDEGEVGKDGLKGGSRYKIESLRGADFFPQTGHVEGVAILSRIST